MVGNVSMGNLMHKYSGTAILVFILKIQSINFVTMTCQGIRHYLPKTPESTALGRNFNSKAQKKRWLEQKHSIASHFKFLSYVQAAGI
jgi:hypothetical protein